tara:strand:- start:7048 stop:7680 length:633 start_codon:yes stop_codon:yes gene_type:complete
MSNYIIYKLCCDDCDEIYVGSTKAYRERKRTHKSRSKNEASPSYNDKIYKTIREFGGWDNWRMIVIEECDETITNKRQVEKREEEFRKELKAELNSNRAFKTKQDESDDSKTYYEKNQEDIKAKRNAAYWADPEKDHAKCKKWRDNNPDKIAEANKKKNERWQEVKDKKNAEKREMIECGCGSKHTKGITARHSRTKKHQDWVNSCETCS